MQTMALFSMKGGVGKTASAVNLAWLASRAGLRVLLWDLDPQAASTFYLRVRADRGGARKILTGRRALEPFIKASDYAGLHLLPARFSFRTADVALADVDHAAARLARAIRPLAGDYDLLVFDCAPGLSLVNEAVIAASTLVLVPVIPTPLSVRTLAMVHRHLGDATSARLHPFYCMVDRRKSLHREMVGDPATLVVPPMRAQVPYATQVEQMGVRREPLGKFARGCAAERAYEQLWNEVKALLGAPR